MKDLFYGITAGLLIGIGGTVFLSMTGAGNKLAGAIFFAVALICICAKGYSLYTGKVGFMAYNHKAGDFLNLLMCFVGNLIGTVVSGLAIMYAIPAVSETAKTICEAKLTQNIPEAFIKAVFCGILMYLAVATYREKNTYIGILFCVPVFILSGFEHSIANMYYFAVSGMGTFDVISYILLIVLGNSVGGLLFPVLGMFAECKSGKEAK